MGSVIWRSIRSAKTVFSATRSMSSGPVLEGVLAIHKPAAISSAQVIRDAQKQFDPSKTFKPWLDREIAKRDAESHNQKNKRKWHGRRTPSVKMGHGGTLDPMATGVLILGLGSGTKQLGHFTTECTKTYETVVLFGAATDTYDTEGKIVGRAPYEHVSREIVEAALEKFKGKGMQKPPIFSALKVQGKKLYEYAREGKEVPIEIKERPVEVHELEMLDWMEGGSHKYNWPLREAEQAEKEFAEKALDLAKSEPKVLEADSSTTTSKRKRDSSSGVEAGLEAVEPAEVDESSSKRSKTEETPHSSVDVFKASEKQMISDTSNANAAALEDDDATKSQQDREDAELTDESPRAPCPAPACRIRMKVTSGFYVRSLCQDLGAAVGSLGMMTELVRTQQGDFVLGTNVLEYEDLDKGEDVWGPRVVSLLKDWSEKEKTKTKA